MVPKLNDDGTVNLENVKARYDYMQVFWKYHSDYAVTVTNGLMYELACAGQISESYLNNPSLRYKHTLIILKRAACYFNNARETGSPYVPGSDIIKLYCNGVTEYYESKGLLNRV